MTQGPVHLVLVIFFLLAGMPFSSPALAQTSPAAPSPGYVLHDETTRGAFVVRRWVNPASPDVSPAGMCECLTVVYQGARIVLTLGTPGTIEAISVEEATGQDVNDDGLPEIIASTWSGGAHCCYTTAVYSVGTDTRSILSVRTGNCGPGQFSDLDGDRILELVTCDDQWAYAYCSFAFSPFPQVVLTYDLVRREYVPATPRFGASLRDQIARNLDDAQKTLTTSQGRDLGMDKCTVLQPALGLMYSGSFDEGVALLRTLYQGGDRDEFERQTVERVRSSSLWIPR